MLFKARIRHLTIFGLKNKETAKLGPKKITVKSSDVSQPPLSAVSSTAKERIKIFG